MFDLKTYDGIERKYDLYSVVDRYYFQMEWNASFYNLIEIRMECNGSFHNPYEYTKYFMA